MPSTISIAKLTSTAVTLPMFRLVGPICLPPFSSRTVRRIEVCSRNCGHPHLNRERPSPEPEQREGGRVTAAPLDELPEGLACHRAEQLGADLPHDGDLQ